jgi:tripartite-type tricarboxylate transporter receptor subunit TctC
MKIQRGTILTITFMMMLVFTGATSLGAADYPSRPIKIIVPFGAGDAVDGTARVMADRMKKELKIPVIVQNIAGGGGAIGIAEAAKAAGDGYTLVMGSTGALTARPLISNPGYETADFVPLAQLVEVPLGVAVREKSPFTSLAGVIEAAKSKTVTYATPAPGTTQHINMSQFAMNHGLKLTHVGGKGGKGAVTKVLTGEVDFVFVGASNYVPLSKAGKLRVLGVTSAERVPYLPDVPTFSEQGYPLVAAVWFGLLVRKGTPADIVEKLKGIIYEVAKDEKTLKLYEKFYFTEAFLSAEAFQERIDANVNKHRKVLQEIGLAK